MSNLLKLFINNVMAPSLINSYPNVGQRFPKALGWVSDHTPTPLGTVGASQHH